MAYELIYTSHERGLRPGTRGFCTVAHTRGLQPQHIQLLEALSAYKNLYGVHDGQESAEPVAWSHITNRLLGHSNDIISRVGPTAADHTGRSNKLAHHVLLSVSEHPAGGPAWLSSQEGFFLDHWEGAPHVIDTPKTIPSGDSMPCPAKAWEALTGDAAYAAYLPCQFLSNPDGFVLVVFKPGMDMLPLIAESLALLEPSQRWKVTYTTYFTSLPVGATCAWRCCVADSEELRAARRNPRSVVLDLTGALPPVPTGPLADRARNGWNAELPAAEPTPEPDDKPRKFVLLNNRNINMLTMKPRKL